MLKISGVKHWLWRAVDQTGIVLDVLVQPRRDKRAAKRLLRELLKKQTRPPRVMITDKLASYGAAKREVMPGIEHRQHKGLNNRAENSHQPTRRRCFSRVCGWQWTRRSELAPRSCREPRRHCEGLPWVNLTSTSRVHWDRPLPAHPRH